MINDISSGSSPFSQDEIDQLRGQRGGEFSKGLRSGSLSMRSDFNNALGAAGAALGLENFSRDSYADADRLAQEAAVNAPRVTSFRDIGAPGGRGTLRDAVDWAAGTIGGTVPSAAVGIGAGVLTPVGGLGAAGALAARTAAGTLAYTPLETGNVVARMREQGDPVEFGQALGTGLGSSALQSVVPALVAGRLAPAAAGATRPPMTLSRAGATLAGEGLLEGATEAGGEAVKQLGTGKTLTTLDGGQLIDSFAGGVVGGAAMSGAGSAGQAAREALGSVPKGLQDAKDAATGLLARGKDAAKEAVPVDLQANDPVEALRGMYDGARTKAKDTLRKIAESEDIIGDAREYVGAQGEKLRSKLAGDDNERVKAVESYVQELAGKVLTPEQQQAVSEWMADKGNHAKQAAVAAIKRTKDGVDSLAQRMRDFGDRMKLKRTDGSKFDPSSVVDAEQPSGETKRLGVKKSEDFSGADEAIRTEVLPILLRARPELADGGVDPEVFKSFTRGMRQLLSDLSSGQQPSSDALIDLIAVAGPETTNVIEAAYRAVGQSKDKKQTAAFFRGLLAVDDTQKASDNMVGKLRAALRPELRKVISDDELRAEAQLLQKWAASSRSKLDDPEVMLRDRKVREALAKRYGDNAEAVIAAVERSLPREENAIERARPELDEEGNVLGVKGGHGLDREIELSGQKLTVHSAKGGLMYLSPDVDEGRGGNLPAAKQRMAKVKQETGVEPRMLTVDELGADHPIVQRTRAELLKRIEAINAQDDREGRSPTVPDPEAYVDQEIKNYVAITTEHSDSPLAVAPDEVRAMALDTHNYGKSKSRVDTGEGGPILDAVKMQRFMQQRFKDEYSPSDEASRVVRMGRMFIEAAAAVQESLGRTFKVSDDLVIGRLGNKDITLGDARKFDRRTDEDKAYDADTMTLVQLRKEFKDAEGRERKKILKKAESITKDRQYAKDRELGGDGGQPSDPTEFGSETDDGLALNKPRMREIEAELAALEKKPNSPNRRKRERELMEEFGRLSLDRNTTTRAQSRNKDRNSGQREVDPFGQIHQATGFNENREPQPFKQAGGAEAGMGEVQAPGLLGTRRQRSVQVDAAAPALTPKQRAAVDRMAANEDYSKLTTRSQVDNFLAAARQRYAELKAEDQQVLNDDDHPTGQLPEEKRKALATLESLFGPKATADLDAFYDGVDEGPPDPKVVAAKKAALLKAASSGDPALLQELRNGNDAKALQRAAEALNAGRPDANTQAAIDAANERIAELVRADETVGYGLQTKRYSLMATQIHSELGRPGFAATHDSPIRHEGRFDWRAHKLKGEGAMAFGAGTYLSTGEGVHKYYKEMFTAKVEEEADGKWLFEMRKQQRMEPIDNAMRELSYQMRAARANGETEEATRLKQEYDKLHAQLKAIDAETFKPKSPTYEVSVDIPPERLLDWNKPLGEQSASVRLRALQAIRDNDLDTAGRDFPDNDEGTWQGAKGHELYGALATKLGSQEQASDYLQSLGILGHVYAAANGSQGKTPNYVIYDDSRITTNYVHFDKTRTAPGGVSSAADRKEVLEYMNRTLGDSVRVAWRKFTHAGEFERVYDDLSPGEFEDVIRISVHAMNPMGVAYHESLHAFFQKLGDLKGHDIMRVVQRAAESAPVMNQLKKLLANHPEALKQLNDPEERAAYMYQFWSMKDANGNRLLNIGPETQNVFQRIAAFFREVLGIWSNDARAVHVLEYFHSGEFNTDRTQPFARDIVQQKLMVPGRNKAVETARHMTKPLLDLSDTLMSAGSQRLRDTGVPALRELADAMKLRGTSEGDDPGFIPAARAERTRVMNALAGKLKGTSEAALNAALESLQTKSNAPIDALAASEARLAAREAKKEVRAVLDSMYQYMTEAGVKVNDLGVGKDYFPRVYDISFISSHQDEFKAVLAKHGVTDGDAIVRKIMTSEGNEFTIEVDQPGMQHLKLRKLAFIPDAELAPFMRKNALEILNGYVTQATRRAEWARRFKDDSVGVTRLLARAKAEGATDEQLEVARDFIRSVDGTLGDTIDPSTRRMFGNIMVYQNIRLLPMAIFSSVVDPMGIMVRGGTLRNAFDSFKRGVRETVKNFKKDATDDDMTQLAAALGTIDDAALLRTLGASYSQGMVGDTSRKINDVFFRYNLMEQFGTSMRVGATEAALGFIARHADGKASKHSQRWLAELGLEPGQIKLDADGRPLLFEHQGLTAEEAAKMRVAVNRWVDGAVLRPDAADKAIWMNDPHFALIAHLKSFVFAFHQTILKRVVHEYEHGNHAPAMALASYVPIMIAADLVKGFIQGGGEQPDWKQGWTMSDYIASGIERAGLYGTGQFLVDGIQDFKQGGTGVGALLGPTVEQLVDAAAVMGGRGQFESFFLKSMPANALYRDALGSDSPERTVER